jgi:hypothetical protein
MATTAIKPLVTVDTRYLEWSSLSAEQHVVESLGNPVNLPEELEELLARDYVTEHEGEVLAYLEELTGVAYEHVHRDNTYNHEQDLDSSLLWSVFAPVDCSDWIWANDVFVAVAIHEGGDVRGNYGPDRFIGWTPLPRQASSTLCCPGTCPPYGIRTNTKASWRITISDSVTGGVTTHLVSWRRFWPLAANQPGVKSARHGWFAWMGYLSPALSPLNPPTTVAERNWYPPQALSGLHYQVWTSSSSGYGGCACLAYRLPALGGP